MTEHIVFHDKKEVWFKGDYPTCMGYKSIAEKHYPGYKVCICNWDDFYKLKEEHK